MQFYEFVRRNNELAKVRGHAKEALIRDLLTACDSTDERVFAAMMLCGRLARVNEPYTTGIKETFIANDLALEGMNSLEAMREVILSRAQCTYSRSITYVWDILRTYLEREVRSKDAKSRIITDCLQDLPGEPEDAVFLLRLLTGKMGNGADERTILHAVYGPDHDREKLTKLYAFNPDIAVWVEAHDNPDHQELYSTLFEGTATPGVPMEPQLCARVKNLSAIIEAHKMTLVQTKLDGMRVHVHLQRNRASSGIYVRQAQFFSREQKEITKDYEELFKEFGAVHFNGQCILDGELVALAADGSVAPFSRLQKRLGRKTGRNAYRVGIVLYDILCYDDAPIMQTTYEVRLKILQGLKFGENVRVIESKRIGDADTLNAMLLEAHDAGEEGLVCKDPLSLPSPGQRGIDWVKCKADYMDSTEFGDSYDLVVVGYNKGRGKRHGTIGALWCATGGHDDQPVTILCKVGTGFSDEDLEWFRTHLERAPVLFNDSEIEVPVMTKYVIEVKAASVSQDESGAYSLRHPRFIRVREDKEPRSATTMREIQEAMR